jgi:hypothetical protein
MLSMMTPKPTVMSEPLNQVKSVGRTSANALQMSTQSGNASVRNASIRKTGRIV